MDVSLTVNGTAHTVEVEPRSLLVDVLRDRLGLTGTKIGCETGECGACTVHLDGAAVKSCLVLAPQAERPPGDHDRGDGRGGRQPASDPGRLLATGSPRRTASRRRA